MSLSIEDQEIRSGGRVHGRACWTQVSREATHVRLFLRQKEPISPFWRRTINHIVLEGYATGYDAYVAIIDVHHHWVNEPDYPDHLLRAMDAAGVERTGLMAMGRPFLRLFLKQSEPIGCVDNHDLAHLLARRNDRFYGYGFFRIGQDEPSLVDWFAENGFTGVKFHIPGWNYDDDRCFPIYERAARHNLICLFHTGPFLLPEKFPGRRLSSARCRPIMLEPIAQEFPSLRMIIAHLGVCWADEATTLCRMHANIYADLSGNPDGWRASKPVEWFREMLYWPTAHKKIVFGSDLHYAQLQQAIDDQTNLLHRIGWTAEQIQCVLHGNAAALFAKQ